MAALAKNSAGPTGMTVNDKYAGATTGGDTAPTGTGVFLLAKNTSGGSLSVLIAYPNKYDGDQTVTGRTFTIAATSGESVIPLRDVYRDPATGLASITYPGGVASGALTVCVVAVP